MLHISPDDWRKTKNQVDKIKKYKERDVTKQLPWAKQATDPIWIPVHLYYEITASVTLNILYHDASLLHPLPSSGTQKLSIT